MLEYLQAPHHKNCKSASKRDKAKNKIRYLPVGVPVGVLVGVCVGAAVGVSTNNRDKQSGLKKIRLSVISQLPAAQGEVKQMMS